MIAGSLEIQLLANLARLQSDMNSATRMVGGATDQIKSAAFAANAAFSSLTLGVGVAGFVSITKSAIDAADAMNDMTQRVGINIRDLAGYELAAQQSGTTMESIAKGIKGLGGTMSDHGKALRVAGFDAKDANGLFIQMADLFSKMPDGMEKTTLATDIFGKAGMDLIPMLNMGSKGLKDAAEKSAKYATELAIAAPIADEFNDQMAEIGLHSRTVGMSMLNQALPGLLAITKEMANASREGGILAGVMAGVGVAASLYEENVNKQKNAANKFFGANIYNIKKPSEGGATGSWGASTGGATGGWGEDTKATDKAVNDAKEVANKIKAIRAALSKKDGAGGGGKGASEQISEYTRMVESLNRVVSLQDLELSMGGKLSASDKFRFDEMQKINAAYATKKISLEEQLRLMALTETATGKMSESEKRAAAVKASQAQYAEQVEHAEELAANQVMLSKAYEDGLLALQEYSKAVTADNEYTALQLGLVGATEQSKTKAIELYRIELDLKKQIAAIDGNAGFNASQKGDATAKANATAALALAGATSNDQLATANQAFTFGQSIRKPEDVERDNHAKTMAMLVEFRDQKLANAIEGNRLLEAENQRHTDAMDTMQTAHEMSKLQATKGAFDQMYGIMVQAGMEKTALGKATFIASKALAIAEIIMNTEVAASVASKQFGAYGAVIGMAIRAAGYASAGMVAGMAVAEVSGKRESGGSVGAGKMYEVNERGPELLSVGNRDYLMMGARHGSVTPNNKLAAAGTAPSSGAITIINHTSAPIGKVSEKKLSNGDRAFTLEETTTQMVAQMNDPNSPMSRAMRRNFDTQRTR